MRQIKFRKAPPPDVVFSISQLSDIESVLIPIFEEFPLKYLDYLDFKAFFMFKSRKSNELSLLDMNSSIIELKDSMNTKRIHFYLPDNKSVRITGNYLIGLLEGPPPDGSFYLNKQDFTVVFHLVLLQ